MSRTRVIIGAIASAIVPGVILPIVYWQVAILLDMTLGLVVQPFGAAMALLLTALTWALGLFWILWAYSYLIFIDGGSPFEAFGVAVEPTKRLVTTGPFAYVRNPMAFGLLFIFAGVAFLANSISGLFLIPVAAAIAALYLRVFEERQLESRFGIAYEHYRRHVPLLFPRSTAYWPPEGPP